MRTHLRLLLPRLALLTTEDSIAFAVINHRQQIQREGEMPLALILQTFAHLPVVCWLATGDAMTAELELPPLKKSQLHTAIRSRLQTMLLHPYEHYVIAYLPQHPIRVHWALKKTLSPLLQQFHRAGIQRIQLIPAAALSQVPNPSDQTSWKTQALPKLNLSFTLESQQKTTAIWSWFKWPIYAAFIGWTSLVLLNQKQARQLQQIQQENALLVKRIFPTIPLVFNPLAQAKQALLQQQEQTQPMESTPNLTKLLTQVNTLIPELSDQVRAMHYEKDRLQLVLIEPLGQLLTANAWQTRQEQAILHNITIKKDEENSSALWIETSTNTGVKHE